MRCFSSLRADWRPLTRGAGPRPEPVLNALRPAAGSTLAPVTASIWIPIVTGVLVLFGLLMAGVVVGAYLVWRYGRRKWRAFHSHGAVVAAMTLWEATAAGRLRPRAPLSAESASQWTARRVRKEMWRAVDKADAAVRAATQVGAPTASLPSLCRRLRDSAIGLDQVLRVEPAGPVPPEVAEQAVEVVGAAQDLQRAAVASASDATGQQVSNLAADADQEIRLLDAGLASARAVLPRPDAHR